MGWLGRPTVFQKVLPATRNCLTQTVTSGGNTFSITIFGIWKVSWCGNITRFFVPAGQDDQEEERKKDEEEKLGQLRA